jgi:hypothetical protein
VETVRTAPICFAAGSLNGGNRKLIGTVSARDGRSLIASCVCPQLVRYWAATKIQGRFTQDQLLFVAEVQG